MILWQFALSFPFPNYVYVFNRRKPISQIRCQYLALLLNLWKLPSLERERGRTGNLRRRTDLWIVIYSKYSVFVGGTCDGARCSVWSLRAGWMPARLERWAWGQASLSPQLSMWRTTTPQQRSSVLKVNKRRKFNPQAKVVCVEGN